MNIQQCPTCAYALSANLSLWLLMLAVLVAGGYIMKVLKDLHTSRPEYHSLHAKA